VVHTHRSLCSGFEAMKRKLHEFFRGSPLDAARRVLLMVRRYRRQVLRAPWRPRVWFTPVPLSSITGFTFVLQCLLLGQTFVTMRTFHPRHALRLIERHRVSFLALTPTLVDLMVRLLDVDEYDLSSLFVIGLGASPARPELVARVRARFDCAVVVGYGSTELGGGVLATDLLDPDEAQVSTVGRPFPGAEVRIVDDDRRELPAGVAGELACRSPGLMAGYSAGAFAAAVDDDGWYYSGDLAVRDGDGRVRVLGRKDDLIIRAGKKVYPSEVERVIATCAHVREAAVVGTPGPRGEDRICAYVVPEADGTPDVADIKAACRTQLAAYKAPEAVFLVDALPTTTAQAKVHRAVLRADATTRLTARIKEAP
jgi:acyl-CoA synthetase (AMP-forming)/AMP-acid ligase II